MGLSHGHQKSMERGALNQSNLRRGGDHIYHRAEKSDGQIECTTFYSIALLLVARDITLAYDVRKYSCNTYANIISIIDAKYDD
jgi:hypothetical protein